MKRTLSFGFLLMGFSFTVTQGLLIRELLVAFFGNELSIGLILGNWLILEAIGSGLLGRLADRQQGKISSFAVLQVLFALFLPLSLCTAYISRSIVGAIRGEGIGLMPIFRASLLPLVPLALIDGAMFSFGCRISARFVKNEASSIGWVYVCEAGGAIVGGVVFTYLFIPFLYPLQIALVLSSLNLLSAFLVLALATLYQRKRASFTPGLIVVLLLLIATLSFLPSPQAEKVQQWATSQQWAGHNLVYSENSIYGNVAVVQQGAQYTFYADGIPILTAPVPDVALSEEIVHLPLLFLSQPRRALVLSGGLGGVLYELVKYPLEQIDYAELDPLLIEAVLRFPTSLTRSELGDPRVQVNRVDGRLLVRRKTWEITAHLEERYDLVIVNLPYPSTLQLNRFYTVEFFQMGRRLLAEEGVLVIGCPGTLTYMSAELRNLNTMVCHTLQRVFPSVRPIPGDLTLWLASPSDILSALPVEALLERWERRGLETQLLTPYYIRLRLDQRRLDWFWTSLGGRERDGGAMVNRDLHPRGLFYGLSYWNALFSPHLGRAFAFIGRLKLWALGLTIIGCSLLFLTVVKLTGKGKAAIIPITITATGFSGMTADLVIILAFQTLYGYVYYWIGLLITGFMAGLSLGGLLMSRRLDWIGQEKSTLLKLESAIVLFWAILPATLLTLYSRITYPLLFASIQGILLCLNALIGFLVGSQFPLANRIRLKERAARGGTAGVLYACDLVGAFLGSIIVPVVLLPILGILETCFLAALVKSISLLMVAALTSPS